METLPSSVRVQQRSALRTREYTRVAPDQAAEDSDPRPCEVAARSQSRQRLDAASALRLTFGTRHSGCLLHANLWKLSKALNRAANPGSLSGDGAGFPATLIEPKLSRRQRTDRRHPLNIRIKKRGSSDSPSLSRLFLLFCVAGRLSALSRRRDLGHQHSGRLGICDHQFRLVDRDRPRRHVHFRHPAAAVSKMAHDHQSLHRGDDACSR